MLNRLLQAGEYKAFKENLVGSSCSRCGLSRYRTNIVADRGNAKAKVLFIGEAPGENEDLQGKAFVGRAGRLLDEMLKEIGFDTNHDALIVNVVKCRPPGNRAPLPEEAEACRPFLNKQIELVRPRLMVLLGATALKHMMPERKGFSMREQAGQCFQHASYPGMDLMVLYHPAYILRDPRKKPLMAQHLNVLKEFWNRYVKIES
jgi:DNA polymerase